MGVIDNSRRIREALKLPPARLLGGSTTSSQVGTINLSRATQEGTGMLTWQTDPLLVDPNPIPWQQWRTANHLLTEASGAWTPHLFLREFKLNFYGIMVRKNDFVKTKHHDRLLLRFPYLCLTGPLQEIVEAHHYRLGMKVSQYFRGSEYFSPLEGRKKTLMILCCGSC
ncbi:MAG: hypothetical protein ACE5OZ_05820 [Candidatus Heimdallarchaeota archaeon]